MCCGTPDDSFGSQFFCSRGLGWRFVTDVLCVQMTEGSDVTEYLYKGEPRKKKRDAA